MSDQQILPCTMCQSHHDQMLMLACIHDPCINCAAIHFNQNVENNSSNMYPCAKCGELTQLDPSSVLELQRVYAIVGNHKKRFQYRRNMPSTGAITGPKNFSSGKKSQSYAMIDRNNDSNLRTNQYSQQTYSGPQQVYPQTSSYPVATTYKKSLPYICSQHADQQISYYCFTCHRPICPQCAIHGTHRDHQVQTTRKSIKTIKSHLMNWNQKIGQQVSIHNNNKDNCRKNLKDITDNLKKQKLFVQEYFNKLKVSINQKQKQFYKVIDNNYDQNSLIVKTQINNIQRMLDQLSTTKKNIQNMNKKDDIAILQQYSSKQQQVKHILESSMVKKNQQEPKKQADYRLMQQQIQQLIGILQAMRLSTSISKR